MQKTPNSTDLRVWSSKKAAMEAQDLAWNTQKKQQRVFTRELSERNCGLNSPNIMATMMHKPDLVCHHALEEWATQCCLSVWLVWEASGGTQTPQFVSATSRTESLQHHGMAQSLQSAFWGCTNRTFAKKMLHRAPFASPYHLQPLQVKKTPTHVTVVLHFNYILW